MWGLHDQNQHYPVSQRDPLETNTKKSGQYGLTKGTNITLAVVVRMKESPTIATFSRSSSLPCPPRSGHLKHLGTVALQSGTAYQLIRLISTSSYSWPSIVTQKHGLAALAGRPPSGAAKIGPYPVHPAPEFLSRWTQNYRSG